MIPVSSMMAIFCKPGPKAPSSSIDVSIWKWVIVIGVVAVILFWGIKRISDIVVKKKTASMIRDVVDNKTDGAEDIDKTVE